MKAIFNLKRLVFYKTSFFVFTSNKLRWYFWVFTNECINEHKWI